MISDRIKRSQYYGRPSKEPLLSQNNVYSLLKGRMFERWIDTAGSRTSGSTGYTAGNLIETPIYIIESLLRDEIYVERDLTITTIPADPFSLLLTVDGLKSSQDDYYNNAIIYNHTNQWKDYVADYVGSIKRITLGVGSHTMSIGDNISLSNIQGNNRINDISFDAAGNTTNGTRNGWKFRFSLNQKRLTRDLISQMLFECHCIAFDTYAGLKITPLDATTNPVDTWTVPLNQNSARELVSVKLTPLSNVYTDFRLKYAYDYGKNDYMKEYFVNPSGYTPGASLSVEKGLCSNAVTNYNIPRRNYEYHSDFIYDDTTAQNLLKKLVAWFTSQKLIVNWSGEISTHIKYEKGDQVKINYPNMIPSGINNSGLFLITGKTIQPKKKVDLSLSTF